MQAHAMLAAVAGWHHSTGGVSVGLSGDVSNAYWSRNYKQANVDRDDPRYRNDDDGSRAGVEGQGAFTDFNHPPSILPISWSADCAWKISVSLPVFSSRLSRNLRIAVS